MGDLRDQLIKKGLANEKRARAVTHEEEARKRRLGPEAALTEKRERDQKAREEAERKQAEDRRREEERRRLHDQESERNRVPDLIRSGLMRDGGPGSRRFYFVTRENTISFLDVSDVASRNLADGRCAIVESLGVVRNDFCLVGSEQAAELARLDPDRLRFWNGGTPAAPHPSPGR